MKPLYSILLLLHCLAGLSQPPKSSTVFTHLDSACKYKDSVRYLNLRRERIEHGKLKYLKAMPRLTSLVLESGYLSEMPAEIFEIRHLEQLTIRWIKMTKIPKEITRLENLRQLDISSTLIEDIPHWLYQMKQLQTLRVTNNKIVRLQNNIPLNSALHYLDLSSNELSELPETLGNLGNLKTLSIGNNGFTQFPHVLTSLPQLEKLELENNHLTRLPDLSEMSKLKTLFISRNPLPASSISPLPPSLQSFYANDINFSEIPHSLKNCPGLQTLIITNGTITSIPDWMGSLDSLKWINLEKNKINQLPVSLSQLSALEKLVVNDNHIDSIPPDIFAMPALIELSVNNNPLQHLSPALFLAKSLRRLNIENTLIPQNEYKQYRRELAQQPVIIIADDKESRREEWRNRRGPCYQEDEIFDYEVFTKTEIGASFNGTFSSFFNRGLQLQLTGISDTVVLHFIVKPGGGITKITALKFNNEVTKNEAVSITKSSCSYWKPGITGGRELLTWCTLQFVFNSNYNQQQPAKTTLTVTKLPHGKYPALPAKPL